MKRINKSLLITLGLALTLGLSACTSCSAHTWSSSESSISSNVNVFEVTFDAYGGHFSDGSKRMVVEVEEGQLVSAPSASWENHELLYWHEKDKAMEFDFARPITQNTILLAKWEAEQAKITKCDIPNSSFDKSKKTIDVVVYDRYQETLSIKDQLTLSPGASFVVFDDNGTYNPSNIPLTKIDNAYTIEVISKNGGIRTDYALNIKKYYEVTIEYYILGDLARHENTSAMDEYYIEFDPYIPTGYRFLYWTLEDGGSEAVQEPLAILDDTVFYAKVEEIVVTIIADAGDGGFSNGATYKEYRVSITSQIKIEVPTWADHTFLGFFFEGYQVTSENGTWWGWSQYDKESYTIVARWGGKDYLPMIAYEYGNNATMLPHFNTGGPFHVFYGEMYQLAIVERQWQIFVGWWLGDVQLTDGKGFSLAPWAYEEYKTYVVTAHFIDPTFTTEYYVNDKLVHTEYFSREEYNENRDLWVYETDNPTFYGWTTNGNKQDYTPDYDGYVTKTWEVLYIDYFARLYAWIDE